ncbi:hypothetical protein [Hufsiella ginkgonis]|uniref:Uncharacterized protein n=1 Tax=Hufsiella ginkgonis TaxID=2695274 RepID=A0A7K1Y3W3_9SPHI|nr:hypothetical protein [Hufsiella ginkgonis]MXV17965.1 hypothetical protein [Hufsiella ginkgonis]
MDQEGKKEENIEAVLLESAGKENPFTVPGGYFAALESSITGQVRLEALKAGMPAPFLVPEGYFNDLQLRINSQLPVTKVRRMRPWINYAAAACVTLVIGTTLYMNFSKPSFERQLEAIPDEEIISYLENNSDTGDTDLILDNLAANSGTTDNAAGLTDKEVEAYLEATR